VELEAPRGFVVGEIGSDAEGFVDDFGPHALHRVRAVVIEPALVDTCVHHAPRTRVASRVTDREGTIEVQRALRRAKSSLVWLSKAALTTFAVLKTLFGNFAGAEGTLLGLGWAEPDSALVRVHGAVQLAGGSSVVEALSDAIFAAHVGAVAFFVAVDDVVTTEALFASVSFTFGVGVAVPSGAGFIPSGAAHVGGAA